MYWVHDIKTGVNLATSVNETIRNGGGKGSISYETE